VIQKVVGGVLKKEKVSEVARFNDYYLFHVGRCNVCFFLFFSSLFCFEIDGGGRSEEGRVICERPFFWPRKREQTTNNKQT